MDNLYLETELGPIDLLGSIKGVGEFEQVRAASIEVELFGRRCRVISQAMLRGRSCEGTSTLTSSAIIWSEAASRSHWKFR